MFQPVIAAIIG